MRWRLNLSTSRLSRLSRASHATVHGRWRIFSVSCQEPVRHCRSWRGEGGAARCKAAGPEKPEVYSLKYIEDFFGPRTTQMSWIVRRNRTVNVGQAPRRRAVPMSRGARPRKRRSENPAGPQPTPRLRSTSRATSVPRHSRRRSLLERCRRALSVLSR